MSINLAAVRAAILPIGPRVTAARTAAARTAAARTVVFTDASVRDGNGGIAFAARRPDGWSVFSAHVEGERDINRLELVAVSTAVAAFRYENLEILTDSQTALDQLRRGTNPKYRRVALIVREYMARRAHTTVLTKVKAHSGVLGNDVADSLAWLAAANAYTTYPPRCHRVEPGANDMFIDGVY